LVTLLAVFSSLTKRRAFQSYSPDGASTTMAADKHLSESSSSCNCNWANNDKGEYCVHAYCYT